MTKIKTMRCAALTPDQIASVTKQIMYQAGRADHAERCMLADYGAARSSLKRCRETGELRAFLDFVYWRRSARVWRNEARQAAELARENIGVLAERH